MNSDTRVSLKKDAILLDRIYLRDYVLTIDIGAFSQERGTQQRICVSVEVEVLPGSTPLGDDVDKVLSYDLIVAAIDSELAGGRINLLETLADGIANRLAQHKQAARVHVDIAKLDRVEGQLGISITREGNGEKAARSPRSERRPHVFCLPNAVRKAPEFADWLTKNHSGAAPFLGVVEGQSAIQTTTSKSAQRRIELLAHEQAAWFLAADNPQLIVTSTRTEFEHAFMTGTPTLWAPSKMVLDSAEGVGNVPADFAEMVAWFAIQIDASCLTYVDRTPPKNFGDFDGSIQSVTLP